MQLERYGCQKPIKAVFSFTHGLARGFAGAAGAGGTTGLRAGRSTGGLADGRRRLLGAQRRRLDEDGPGRRPAVGGVRPFAVEECLLNTAADLREAMHSVGRTRVELAHPTLCNLQL